MDIHWSNVLKVFFICATVFGCLFAMSSCEMKSTIAIQETKQSYNDLERCVDSCPVDWVTDKDCVSKCLEIEEMRVIKWEK